MCGIGCVIHAQHVRDDDYHVKLCKKGNVSRTSLFEAVRRRGHDAWSVLKRHVNAHVFVEAASGVLRLRGGSEPVVQPLLLGSESLVTECNGGDQSTCPSFLQWNGEVFGGSIQLAPCGSDTAAIGNRLFQLERECSAISQDCTFGDNHVRADNLSVAQAAFAELCVSFLETEVKGPFAFVYYAHLLHLFMFGRDPLGRRSLLTHAATAASAECGSVVEFVISSVAVEHDGHCAAGSGLSGLRKRCKYECNDTHNENGVLGTDGDNTPTADGCSSLRFGCWKELPNTGLFTLSAAAVSNVGSSLAHYPWKLSHCAHPLVRPPCGVQAQLLNRREEEYPHTLRYLLNKGRISHHAVMQELTAFGMWAASSYLSALWEAVSVRVRADHCGGDTATPIGVLFSGGIDSTILAAIAHYVLPTATPIELINVAFGDAPELTPDRLATFNAVEQLLQLPAVEPNDKANGTVGAATQAQREWRLVLIDVPVGSDDAHIRRLIFPKDTDIDISIGTALWHAARGRGRMQRITQDSQVAEQLAARKAYQLRHKLYRLSEGGANSDANTDMESGHEVGGKFAKFSPLIDVMIEELEASGGECATAPVLLSTLGKEYAAALRPTLSQYGYKKLGQYLNDASLAGLVAFAKGNEAPSKAIRLVRDEDVARVQRTRPAKWLQITEEDSPLGYCVEEYECEARVLLLGMGADETLGGYTRHRRAFERRGIRGLVGELDHDFSRLWERNLGRDDRVVSDSGREGRYPYLDEGVLAVLGAVVAGAHQHLVSSDHHTPSDETGVTSAGAVDDSVLELAVSSVCSFTGAGGTPGVGDKKILRRCAALLGLGDVVRLQKRAIQFGSRIAKQCCSSP
ncbi:asparagine synthase, putative [Trypanosoma equiperdum]|uniref:Asparagine synthetase domain-containing protein n=2 Tax=Trypanozoon TaxID=39700 RepID=Q580N6_TRYB2|nr:hypothetical protein, conserved [Trypanosoma brucei brucei TREU927]AAX79311.1 hypothetical protein, conserved [Trypanosoma brucei]AAZ10439.1 hypothetical protein, conserved [Trypanosoma brucei brucei TREU927]SCU69194.1 asparagine synthase, putative [Trypanosoma equiperdum]